MAFCDALYAWLLLACVFAVCSSAFFSVDLFGLISRLLVSPFVLSLVVYSAFALSLL